MQTPVSKRPRDEKSAFSIPPKAFVSRLKGETVPSGEARSILQDQTSNIKQCNAVLTDLSQKTNCWICGEALDFSKKGYPYQPQCDHILPITQANIFLDVYRARNADVITNEMKLEYGWAHAVCNSIKSNQTFLDTSNPDNLKINENKVLLFLQKVSTKIPININDRKIAVINKLLPIVNYINTRGSRLSLLATLASYKDDRPKIGGNIQMQSLFQKALDTAKQQGSTMFVETLKNNEPLIESQVVNALTTMDAPSRDAIINHLTTLANNVRAKFSPSRMTAGRRLKRTIKHKTRRRH